jgi:hypothetical protein
MVSPQYEISDVFAITMTLEAAEGFLPSVNSSMPLQVLRISEDVCKQGAHRCCVYV